MIYVTCPSRILAHLWLNCLDRSGHEINPVKYVGVDMTKILNWYNSLLQKSYILFLAVMVLHESLMLTTSLKLMDIYLFVLAFSVIHFTSVALFAWLYLCLPMFHVSSHMNHFADNSSAEVALDVSLHSLLFGNVELISSILYPTQDWNHLLINIELQRYYEFTNALSGLPLQNDLHMLKLHIDHHLLQVSIMKSFG